MTGQLYAYHNDGQAPWGYVATTHATGHAHDDAGDAALAWAMALVTLGYLLPWALAVSRHREDADTIGLVNLVTGWTVLGWIGALGMALRPQPD